MSPPTAIGPRDWSQLWAGGWLLSVAIALGGLAAYSGQGVLPAGVSTWPSGTALRRVSGEPTLLLFIHPRCPCTRASLANLERILPRLGRPIDLQMVVYRPAGAKRDWDATGIRQRAAQVLGARIVTDVTGIESRRFGAPVSGTVLLYRPDGRLAFAGGVTPARGHEGDSPGATRLLEALKSMSGPAAPSTSSAPVERTFAFGCPVDETSCPVPPDSPRSSP